MVQSGHDMQVDLKPDQRTKPIQTGKVDFFIMRMAEKNGSRTGVGEDSLN
jgi:hypothetical protein